MNQRILIVDGNNLAHQLYSLRKNSRVTLAHAQALTDLLADYLRANPAQRLHIHLFFDGNLAPSRPARVNLEVFPAHDADDDIIQQVFECVREHNQVVVVSGDEDLCMGVAGLGAVTLSAFEFILVHNPQAPRFIYPGSLPFDFQRIAPEPEEDAPGFTEADFTPETLEAVSVVEEPPPALDEIPPAEDTPSLDEPLVDSEPVDESAQVPEPEPAPGPALTTWYRADPAAWPPAEGARFLAGAFCGRHRADAAALVHGGQVLRPADLTALAALLVSTCGDEADFCARGSLMDRVRLALLKAKGDWVSLEALARAIRLSPVGLQGKIKKKAEKWVEISKDAAPGGEAAG
ncbi:MAG TPA: NYN domain-containing protein [Anaerolinea sp.]|nr:NYN domain-containing protein [Anaerolinea sp.]